MIDGTNFADCTREVILPSRYLNIVEKHRQHAGLISTPADFTVSAGESVDAELILTNPHLSLYCFNPAARTAWFVELPETVNLASAPFVYMAQYEHAHRLVEMDYDTFKQAAWALPPIERLIMIYITGRSGSTLLSHVFNELDNVMSLSEPDVGTQFLHLRHAYDMPDAELRELLDCALRVLFRPTPFKTPTTYALKLRSEATRMMDLYQATFPNVKNLYLYRDVVGFVASFYRMFQVEGDSNSIPVDEFVSTFQMFTQQDVSPTLAYLESGTEELSLVQWLTLWWITITEWYLENYARGFPLLAVNYPDLNQKREATLKAIFDYCDLPRERVAETLGAFERDSQAGTFLARENPTEGNKLRLSDEEIAEIRRIVEQHPVIKSMDFVVPGTLQV